MTQQLQFVMLAGAVALLGLIFFFLKKGYMSVKYSLLWLGLSVLLVIFAACPYVVYVLRDILDIQMPVNLVFLLMFCFVLVVLLSLSIAISQLAENANGWHRPMRCWKSVCGNLKNRKPTNSDPSAGRNLWKSPGSSSSVL